MSETEYSLTSIAECFVYRLGPRPSAKGYMFEFIKYLMFSFTFLFSRCRDWKPEDHIWTGKVTVLARGDKCIVRLEDPKTG